VIEQVKFNNILKAIGVEPDKNECIEHMIYLHFKQTYGQLEALQEIIRIRDEYLRKGYMPEWVNEEYVKSLHEATITMSPKITITKTTVYSRGDIAEMLGAVPNQVEVRVLATTGMPNFEIIVTEEITESQNGANHG
jgi:hypothetical protein